MQRITIEIDDTGRASVTTEGGGEPQTMDFETVAEALRAIEELVEGEPASEMDDDESAEPDAATMWNEEAARRPRQPGLMD